MEINEFVCCRAQVVPRVIRSPSIHLGHERQRAPEAHFAYVGELFDLFEPQLTGHLSLLISPVPNLCRIW